MSSENINLPPPINEQSTYTTEIGAFAEATNSDHTAATFSLHIAQQTVMRGINQMLYSSRLADQEGHEDAIANIYDTAFNLAGQTTPEQVYIVKWSVNTILREQFSGILLERPDLIHYLGSATDAISAGMEARKIAMELGDQEQESINGSGYFFETIRLLLSEMSVAPSSSEMLQVLADKFVSLIGADALYAYFVDNSGDEPYLVPAAITDVHRDKEDFLSTERIQVFNPNRRTFTAYVLDPDRGAGAPLYIEDVNACPPDMVDPEITAKYTTDSITLQPIYDENGNIIAIFTIGYNERDLEHPRFDQQTQSLIETSMDLFGIAIGLRQQKEKLEQSQTLIDLWEGFIGKVLHDGRAPAGNIATLVYLIRNDHEITSGSKLDELLNAIESSAGEISGLLNKVLDMMNGRPLTPEFKDIGVDHLAQKLIERDASARAKGIDLSFEYTNPDLASTPIPADEFLMESIIRNLLNNAVKYSKESGSDRWIRIEYSEDNDNVYLIVNDNGKGIPKAMLESIFQEGERTDDAKASSIGGYGIGLAGVVASVNAHNGDIWAESDGLGYGSRFIVSLPKTQPDITF